MGYTYDGAIKNYWPDNSENTLYIQSSRRLDDLLETAQEYFGDRYNPEKIFIEPVHIHTYCLTYDQYDPGDYTTFIMITLEE